MNLLKKFSFYEVVKEVIYFHLKLFLVLWGKLCGSGGSQLEAGVSNAEQWKTMLLMVGQGPWDIYILRLLAMWSAFDKT